MAGQAGAIAVVVFIVAVLAATWYLLDPLVQEILWVLVKSCAIAIAAYVAFVAALMRR